MSFHWCSAGWQHKEETGAAPMLTHSSSKHKAYTAHTKDPSAHTFFWRPVIRETNTLSSTWFILLTGYLLIGLWSCYTAVCSVRQPQLTLADSVCFLEHSHLSPREQSSMSASTLPKTVAPSGTSSRMAFSAPKENLFAGPSPCLKIIAHAH